MPGCFVLYPLDCNLLAWLENFSLTSLFFFWAEIPVEGATTAEVFEAFVEHMLVPRLNPGDIVVVDNVGAHKPAHILKRIRAAGARVLFFPPYSPDLNPIELFWNKLKELLESMGARTRQALDDAIARAM